jgi:hypothetical protein
MLKLQFLYTICSNSSLFYVDFSDDFIKVYILCLLCVNIDNNFVPNVCGDRSLTFLSLSGPVSHLMMAEIHSRNM